MPHVNHRRETYKEARLHNHKYANYDRSITGKAKGHLKAASDPRLRAMVREWMDHQGWDNGTPCPVQYEADHIWNYD